MNSKAYSLSGKKVIILGGTSGIGLATAQAVASEGAIVHIVSSNENRVKQALEQLPESVQGSVTDLSREEHIRDFFASAGQLDHLVYTAGENLVLNTLDQTDLARAQHFFTLRFWGALAAVKYAVPNINPGGSVCLTGGIASQRPGKGWALASGICGAMEGLVRALAVELAPVRVNSVVPGVIRTNLWNSMETAERESFYTSVADTLLVNRVGEAEDIAQAFVYLMKQTFATGQNMVIDGGALLV